MEKQYSTKNYWTDTMVQNFYIDYYQNLSSKELDKEFNDDIQTLSKTLRKLSNSDRKIIIGFLSKYIEAYLDNKIKKEIDNSFSRILRF